MCNGQQSRNLTANNQILKKTTALGTRNTKKGLHLIMKPELCNEKIFSVLFSLATLHVSIT